MKNESQSPNPDFTPDIDQLIIREYLSDWRPVVEALKKKGFKPEKVHDRAAQMGLTEQAVHHHHENKQRLIPRRCLNCDRFFTARGPYNRLCHHCRARG